MLAVKKKAADFLSQPFQNLEGLQSWSLEFLYVRPLMRPANSCPGRPKWPPDKDAPKDHATAAKKHLLEKALVEAHPSSVELPKKILKNAAESGIPEQILKDLLLGVAKSASGGSLLRAGSQPGAFSLRTSPKLAPERPYAGGAVDILAVARASRLDMGRAGFGVGA